MRSIYYQQLVPKVENRGRFFVGQFVVHVVLGGEGTLLVDDGNDLVGVVLLKITN